MECVYNVSQIVYSAQILFHVSPVNKVIILTPINCVNHVQYHTVSTVPQSMFVRDARMAILGILVVRNVEGIVGCVILGYVLCVKGPFICSMVYVSR